MMDDEPIGMDITVGDEELPEGKHGGLNDAAVRVAMQVNLLEHPAQEKVSISPLKEQEKKRPRRNGDGRVDGPTNSNAKSALSFEESDRAQ